VTDHRREAALVGGLIAVALALRFLGLSEGDFWNDELYTRTIVDNSPTNVQVTVMETESSPHLYYLLAWAWAGILGVGEASVRSLSAVAGALVAPVAYLTLRQVGLRTEALIAGALAAVSPLLIWYSQEARVYSLFALLTAVALLFFVRALVNCDMRALIGWSIASAAMLLTHYFAIFTIAGMAAVLLYRHRARWQWILLSLLPTAIAALAVLPTIAAQRSGGQRTDWISAIPLPERVLQVPEHFLTGLAYPPLAVVLVAGLLAAIGGAGLLIHAQRGRLVGGGLVGVAAISIGIPVLAKAVNQDFLISRNLIGAIVPLLLAVSVGLGASRLRRAGPIVAVALVCLLAATSVAGEYDHDVERPPWGSAAEAIAEGGEPDMVLACCGTVAGPAGHYLESFEPYEPTTMGEVEVKQVVLATIERPDHRPKDDFCWWGAACQANDVLGPGGPPAYPRELSQAFASTFDRVETSMHGSIKLERYQSSTAVQLGPETPIRLAPHDVVVVGDDRAVNSVEVLIPPRLIAE
jgi:4-amino-4-deoxy-L-arabinose transferase-like glycosyltransferase